MQAQSVEWSSHLPLLVALVAVAVFSLRQALIKRSLRDRKSWAVLPADEFDPVEEDVRRFALAMGRVYGRIRTRFLRPSAAVRFRLETVPEGQMMFVVDGPAAGRTALPMFGRCELQDLATLEVVGGPDVPLLPDPAEEVTP